MQIRDYSLPEGWFPRDPAEISGLIVKYKRELTRQNEGVACIAPHAGWYYCSRLMAKACSYLNKDFETIVVIGGHLPRSGSILFALEDGVKTPLGVFPMDITFRDQFMNDITKMGLNCSEDSYYRDNTVEVLLPMVRFFFPKANLLWLRMPANLYAYEIGKELYGRAKKLGRKIAVIGSADLTHYGANYGFTPQGRGEKALSWVRNVNDAAIIRAIQDGKPEEVIKCAENDSSTCSAGAILCSMGFSKAQGCENAHLLEYATSADIDAGDVPNSFVGYAAMGFGPEKSE